LQLDVHLLWQRLKWVSLFVNHLLAFFCHALLVLCILEKFHNLFGGKVLSQVAELVSAALDLALIIVFVSYHLLTELLLLALSFLLLRACFVDDLLFAVLVQRLFLLGEVLLLLEQHVVLKLLVVHHTVLVVLSLDLRLHLVEVLAPLVGLRSFALQRLFVLRRTLFAVGGDALNLGSAAVNLGSSSLAGLAHGARQDGE